MTTSTAAAIVNAMPFKRMDFDPDWIGIDDIPVGAYDWAMEHLNMGESRVALQFDEDENCIGLITVTATPASRRETMPNIFKKIRVQIIRPDNEELLTIITDSSIVVRERKSGDVVKRYRRYRSDGDLVWKLEMELRRIYFQHVECPASVHWFLVESTRLLHVALEHMRSNNPEWSEGREKFAQIKSLVLKGAGLSLRADVNTDERHEKLFAKINKFVEHAKVSTESFYAMQNYFMLLDLTQEVYLLVRERSKDLNFFIPEVLKLAITLGNEEDPWSKQQAYWISLWTTRESKTTPSHRGAGSLA